MDIGFVTNPSSNDPIHSTSTIWRANLFNHMRVALAEVQGMVMDVAWSPDESSVAYLVYTDAPGMVSGSAHQLWLKAGKAPARALTPLIPLFGRGGSLDDQTIVRFSHDGKYLLMVDTYVAGGPPATPDQAIVQVHSVPDGSLVFVPPSALSQPGNKFFYYVTMAAWSHQTDRLYYRDRDGVQVWEPNMYSTQKTIAAGLNWFLPSISPGDRFVAYVVTEGGSSLSQPHVEVRDLATNAVRVIPGIRAAPFFVSDTLLLVAEYGPNPEQGPGPSYVPTGKGFFFDVRTNVETQTKEVISPIDYWPH